MTSDSELHAPSPGSRRGRTLLAIAVLTVIGPLFVILPVSLFVAAGKLMASPQVRLNEFLQLLLFGLVVGYGVSWPYALLTGLIVAACSLWRQPSLFVALAATLAANAILYFTEPVLAISLGHYRSALEARNFILFSLITVSVCWFIFRRVAKL